MRNLSELINKFGNEKIEGITDSEQVQIFNALKDLEMYQKIGTIAEFMGLKDKQIPKNPIKVDSGVYDYDFDYECPSCGENIDEYEHHCKCGQILNWSEE